MRHFSGFRTALHEFSLALDASPHLQACPLVLGLDFAKLSEANQLSGFMQAAGFVLRDDMWLSDEACYENHFAATRFGNMSLGELQEWCRHLLIRSNTQKTRLHLPRMEEWLSAKESDDIAYSKTALKYLSQPSTGVRLVFHPTAQPKEQAALAVALELLTWPAAWLILLEDMHARHQLSPTFVLQAAEALATFELGDLKQLMELLIVRNAHADIYQNVDTKDRLVEHIKSLMLAYK